MPQKLATLRTELEHALGARYPSPFAYRDRRFVATATTGIAEVDMLSGGLPRGCLTEVYGPPCSGRTTLMVSALASHTSQGEVCALVDGCDSFDPFTAQVSGVNFDNLLWVRCRNLEQSLRSTDLLLHSGGFGLIILDLSDVAPERVRRVPLHYWFRFRRTVENTPTILLFLEREANAKTCASLVLQLTPGPACWLRSLHYCQHNPLKNPVSCLLGGFEVHGDVIRSTVEPAHLIPFPSSKTPPKQARTFQSYAHWNYQSSSFLTK